MNKRDFVKRAAALAALAGAGRAALAAPFEADHRARQPITAVIYDERFSDARRFAAQLALHGAALFPTQRDVARLWYGSLREHVAQHGGRLAGFATHADLTASQSCAAEHGLRLLYEGMHDCRGSHSLTHTLRHSALQLNLTRELREAAAAWPDVLATTLHRTDFAHGPHSSFRAVTGVRRAHDHPGALASWLIG